VVLNEIHAARQLACEASRDGDACSLEVAGLVWRFHELNLASVCADDGDVGLGRLGVEDADEVQLVGRAQHRERVAHVSGRRLDDRPAGLHVVIQPGLQQQLICAPVLHAAGRVEAFEFAVDMHAGILLAEASQPHERCVTD